MDNPIKKIKFKPQISSALVIGLYFTRISFIIANEMIAEWWDFNDEMFVFLFVDTLWNIGIMIGINKTSIVELGRTFWAIFTDKSLSDEQKISMSMGIIQTAIAEIADISQLTSLKDTLVKEISVLKTKKTNHVELE